MTDSTPNDKLRELVERWESSGFVEEKCAQELREVINDE